MRKMGVLLKTNRDLKIDDAATSTYILYNIYEYFMKSGNCTLLKQVC